MTHQFHFGSVVSLQNVILRREWEKEKRGTHLNSMEIHGEDPETTIPGRVTQSAELEGIEALRKGFLFGYAVRADHHRRPARTPQTK
jgi:hypothetical protein